LWEYLSELELGDAASSEVDLRLLLKPALKPEWVDLQTWSPLTLDVVVVLKT
jgi:hypothetical protein